MELSLKRINEKFGFSIENETGAKAYADASEVIGGENIGLRPMQMVAAALASCSSIDILNILYKQKQIVTDYDVKILAKRSDSIPAIFETIHLEIILVGQVAEEKAQRAADLSFQKYCSVSRILEKTCKITYSVTIINA